MIRKGSVAIASRLWAARLRNWTPNSGAGSREFLSSTTGKQSFVLRYRACSVITDNILKWISEVWYNGDSLLMTTCGSNSGKVKNFSLLHVVQTCSAVHPTSYPVGSGGSLPGGKATGA
jgi:hypothetical protein